MSASTTDAMLPEQTQMRSNEAKGHVTNRTERITLGDWNAGKEAVELARPELWCPQGFVHEKKRTERKKFCGGSYGLSKYFSHC
jgi:hypothetical protein